MIGMKILIRAKNVTGRAGIEFSAVRFLEVTLLNKQHNMHYFMKKDKKPRAFRCPLNSSPDFPVRTERSVQTDRIAT